MDTSLEHLPEHKQKQLKEITGIIEKAVDPEKVILFGSHATGRGERARWAFRKHAAGDTVTYPEYDFVERDHLGNERVILTQERDTNQYIATMEAANRATENALFYNIGTTCVARTSVPAPGYPNDTSYTSPNDSVSKLNGNGPTVGPAIILKVMSGDIVDVGTQYYDNSESYTAGSLSPQNLLNSLASGLATLSSAAGESITTLTNPTTSPYYLP